MMNFNNSNNFPSTFFGNSNMGGVGGGIGGDKRKNLGHDFNQNQDDLLKFPPIKRTKALPLPSSNSTSNDVLTASELFGAGLPSSLAAAPVGGVGPTAMGGGAGGVGGTGGMSSTLQLDFDESTAPPPITASKEGQSTFNDNDVLSGRGGGTNVHPGTL